MGCVLIVAACLIAGIGLLLLTPYGLLLVLSAVMSAFVTVCATAVVAKFWRGPPRPRVIAAIAAVLTIALFGAVPIHFMILNWGRGVTGPMFG
jgi:hypothetical protein